MSKRCCFWFAGLLFLPLCINADASTVTSPRVDVSLQATVLNSLTIAVANPAVIFGVVTPGVVNAAPVSQALSVLSSWNLGAGVTVRLYAFFDGAANALTGSANGGLIPTSAITATVNSGSPQSFNATSPFTTAATAMQLFAQSVTTANVVSSRSDTMALTLNLTGLNLQADTYIGTMHLQAQAL